MLAMLISVPVLNTDTYSEENNSYLAGMNMMIGGWEVGEAGFNSLFKSFIENQVRLETPLILANCKNVTWESGLDVRYLIQLYLFSLFS